MTANDKLNQTGVYAIIHVASGKRYIGSSGVSFKSRWRGHRVALNKGKHHSVLLQRAWNKYGVDAFAFTILCITEPHEAVEYEQAFIDLHKSADPKFGYNLAPIAGSPLGVKRTDSQRKAQSERVKKQMSSPEARAAHSTRMKIVFSTLERRTAQSERQKQYYTSTDARAANSARQKIAQNRPEVRAANSVSQKANFDDPVFRAEHSARQRARFADPMELKANSDRVKALNADPVRKADMQSKNRATRLHKRMAKASAMLAVL